MILILLFKVSSANCNSLFPSIFSSIKVKKIPLNFVSTRFDFKYILKERYRLWVNDRYELVSLNLNKKKKKATMVLYESLTKPVFNFSEAMTTLDALKSLLWLVHLVCTVYKNTKTQSILYFSENRTKFESFSNG